MAAVFQFGAEFPVIVNLSIERNNRIAALRDDGLVARLEIDDFQTRDAEGDTGRLKDTLLIRPAVNQRSNCAMDEIEIGDLTLMREAYDSTQVAAPSVRALAHSPAGLV